MNKTSIEWTDYDLMDEHIDSGSRCLGDHPLMLVAEGYAYCRAPGRPRTSRTSN
jgi:hypothetical protein